MGGTQGNPFHAAHAARFVGRKHPVMACGCQLLEHFFALRVPLLERQSFNPLAVQLPGVLDGQENGMGATKFAAAVILVDLALG